MITLYQFPSRGNLPNPSPFCMKLETYLRMAGLIYETRAVLRKALVTLQKRYWHEQ